MPPGLSTGVQSTCCSGNRGLSSRETTWQITRLQGRDPEDLNKVCRICEICGHVNKKETRKMSLLKIENFDFEDRNGM